MTKAFGPRKTGSSVTSGSRGSQSRHPRRCNFAGLDSFLQITFGQTAFGGTLALGGGGVNATNQSGIGAKRPAV